MRAIDRVHLFPVRHHSPRASAVLLSMLERVAPDLVLVEGPSDAEGMLGVLTDPETVPPIAVLAYRTDGTPGSVVWPFVTYSPEYVAVRWASTHGKVARFIDIASGQSLADDEEMPSDEALESKSEQEASADATSPHDAVTARSGYRTFEEFWEASFEAPDYQEDAFHAALMAFADVVRHGGPREDQSRARDAVMLAAIEAALADGIAPEKIVVVLGAAHAAAIASGDVDPSAAARFSRTVPTTVTVIPYSFPRLAEQTGYGAGNRAPFFHQRAHDAGGDYRRAALEVLVDFTDHLRLRGFSVSLADTIEAYRLACLLSEIRGKSGPGLDEVREATIATLCRGESAHVDSFLWGTVVGKGVGRVAKGVGKNSLQEEFWAAIAHFKLPKSDEAEAVALRLSDPVHVSISVLLHRLRTLQIPYGALTAQKRGGAPKAGMESLSRVREAWTCQWTPSTEIALVEAIVLGESLAIATEHALNQRLGEAKKAEDATAVLVDAVVTHAVGTVSLALAACERLAAHDDDLPSLASACRALAGLVSYGSSRESLGADEHVIGPLLVKTFARAALRMPFAARGSDEEAPALTEALRVLHELAFTQDTVDKDAWVLAMREVAVAFDALPRCAGAAAGLLLLSRLWTDDDLDAALRLRMSATSEPGRTAEFLVGFLEVNALAIVKNPLVVGILDAYLQSLSVEAFRDAVPMLRRALAELGKTERRYLVENVVAVRGHATQEEASVAARVVSEKDEAQLRAVSDELSKAMDDLDDLL
ncbi:MAG: hypothetical protein HY898_26295 [Deltaproteobacteria bacterium]|nr:hypothetical protein [Deltaproteobacteria bacterium]